MVQSLGRAIPQRGGPFPYGVIRPHPIGPKGCTADYSVVEKRGQRFAGLVRSPVWSISTLTSRLGAVSLRAGSTGGKSPLSSPIDRGSTCRRRTTHGHSRCLPLLCAESVSYTHLTLPTKRIV